MTGGRPQRHSLLDDKVLHRSYSSAFDSFLDRLVTAFDFPIHDRTKANAVQARRQRSATMKETMARWSEKLCEFVLPDDQKENDTRSPMELGWNVPKPSSSSFRHSWMAELPEAFRKDQDVDFEDDAVFHHDDLGLQCQYEIMA